MAEVIHDTRENNTFSTKKLDILSWFRSEFSKQIVILSRNRFKIDRDSYISRTMRR
ncbi:hypothetical protein WN55_05879 [Dufourea novaeangliae]|uniref:Uncharacterized protein n=1 Tax=Dufourea novaeangliae TaxID=178035 RepID=A0A154PMT4_DUFNO|nr:hypothetical protein WN55_05879 [Dufourea novaeangliae]